MASYLAASLLIALVMSASVAAVPSPSANSGIISAAQEMQRARYFTFVMLIRMVQEKIPRNATFLMPNDRLLSTAPIPENRVLEFLSRHSIASPLLFDDLKRLPNGTMVPTHQSSHMITITNREHQKLYFNNVELISPDVCNVEGWFTCHGISGVIRPIMTRRAKGTTCPRYDAPTAAAPEPTSTVNQPLEPSSLPPPNTGPASSAAMEPAAESPQSSATSSLQFGLSYTTMIVLLSFVI